MQWSDVFKHSAFIQSKIQVSRSSKPGWKRSKRFPAVNYTTPLYPLITNGSTWSTRACNDLPPSFWQNSENQTSSQCRPQHVLPLCPIKIKSSNMTIKSYQPENYGGHYTASEILLLRDILLKGIFRIVSNCMASDLPHIVNTSVLSGVCSHQISHTGLRAHLQPLLFG